MKKHIHHFFAIVPMFALGVSAMIYFFFGIAQFQYKISAENNMEARQGLSTIKIPLAEFKKHSAHNEIWYGGKLYDVSSYSIDRDSASVVIFHDEQEESLIKSIADNFEPNENYTPGDGIHIIKHRVSIPNDIKIKQSPISFDLHFMALAQTMAQRPYIIQYTSTPYTSILKPPPDIA